MNIKRIIAVLLTVLLCFTFAACGSKSNEISKDKAEKLGEGENNFYVVVEKENGSRKAYEIFTDEVTIGDALYYLKEIKTYKLKNGYELVTEILGNKLNYEKDGKYWNFTEAGVPAAADVYSTDIDCSQTYVFKETSAK